MVILLPHTHTHAPVVFEKRENGDGLERGRKIKRRGEMKLGRKAEVEEDDGGHVAADGLWSARRICRAIIDRFSVQKTQLLKRI